MVRINIGGVVQQEVVALRTPGVKHLDGSALGVRGHRGVDVDNAVHDRAHAEKVVNRQENDRHQNQPHQRQTEGHSPS